MVILLWMNWSLHHVARDEFAFSLRQQGQGAGALSKGAAAKSNSFALQPQIQSDLVASSPPAQAHVTIALVSMVGNTPGFAVWLQYYLDFLEFDLLLLQVEDCARCRPLIERYGAKVNATYVTYGSKLPGNNYLKMMKRQHVLVNNALDLCRQRGIDFLLHSDSDELMYVQPDPQHPTLRRATVLREFLAGVPARYDYIHMGNYEALYPRFNEDKQETCFFTNKFVRCGPGGGGCLSYVNGKSIGRVRGRGMYGKGRIRSYGPHSFTGTAFDVATFLPVNPVVAILHYDSCTYKQWQHKFQLLSKTDANETSDQPFAYYRASIQLAQARENEPNNAQLEQAVRTFYYRWKVLPFYHKDYFLFRLWGEGEGFPALALRLEVMSQPDENLAVVEYNRFNKSDPETTTTRRGVRQAVLYEQD